MTPRVFGPPGTGKSTALATTYVPAAVDKFGPEKVMVTSFTRAAAAEIATKRSRTTGHQIGLPEENVGTLHSIAYNALGCPKITETEKEILRARRSGKSLGLLLLDLDGSKAYNDRYLNNAGNIVLQEFAEILGGCVREVDTVARVEDDEFAVILVESNAEGAQALANRIIERFGMHLLPGAGETRIERLSLSVGEEPPSRRTPSTGAILFRRPTGR